MENRRLSVIKFTGIVGYRRSGDAFMVDFDSVFSAGDVIYWEDDDLYDVAGVRGV